MANLSELERVAASGNVTAMTDLGSRLLSGEDEPLVRQRGADWLAAAAEQGSGEACALVAVLAGVGACRPQSWEIALDYLQRSAELGWEPAREQLALLAADRKLVEREDQPTTKATASWQRLRRAIDISAWTASPPKQSLSESPRIRKIENFASEALCAWLIDRARSKLSRVRTYDIETAEGVVERSRTNREAEFNIVESDLILILCVPASPRPPACRQR